MFAACSALYRHIPGVDYRESPEMLCWITGLPHPMMNGGSRARLSPENADAAIAELVARFRERGVPALWWYDPSSQPADLGQRFLAHGFTQGRGMPGMALDLHLLQPALPDNPSLALEEVRDSQTLQIWTEVCGRGSSLPAQIDASFYAACTGIGYGPDSALRLFLCRRNGEPAACAMLCLEAGIAGIYCVATLEAARRQGCGAAVTQACLNAAREQSYRIAILQASAMGEPVYKKLGFETVCRIETYLWRPEA